MLSNGADTNAQCRLSFTIDRHDASGREVLVPGENYLLSLLVKTVRFTKESSYHLRMRTAPDGDGTILLANAQESAPSLASPEGFQRIDTVVAQAGQTHSPAAGSPLQPGHAPTRVHGRTQPSSTSCPASCG